MEVDDVVSLCEEAADIIDSQEKRIAAQDEELGVSWCMANEASKLYEKQCQELYDLKDRISDLQDRVFELENSIPLVQQLNS